MYRAGPARTVSPVSYTHLQQKRFPTKQILVCLFGYVHFNQQRIDFFRHHIYTFCSFRACASRSPKLTESLSSPNVHFIINDYVRKRPVSYTHLDVYKRQEETASDSVLDSVSDLDSSVVPVPAVPNTSSSETKIQVPEPQVISAFT